jgi:hypothetical protein
MPRHPEDAMKQVRPAQRLTRRRPIEQNAREDGTALSLHARFEIEVHHRVPAPHALRELARVLCSATIPCWPWRARLISWCRNAGRHPPRQKQQ